MKKYSIIHPNLHKYKEYIDMYDDILSQKKEMKQVYLALHFKWENFSLNNNHKGQILRIVLKILFYLKF